jgi:predicted permease
MEGNQKKGMSKGCLIGLIVAGVIIVLLVVGFITCYIYKDDLAKMGVVTVINGFKTELASQPVEGVDTVQFNALADAFIAKFNEDKIDYNKYADFFQQLQTMTSSKEITADNVVKLEKMMVDYYPDLAGYLPEPEVPDSLIPEEEATPDDEI